MKKTAPLLLLLILTASVFGQTPTSKEVNAGLPTYPLHYKKAVQPTTFSKSTSVYSRPDTLSKVVKTFSFNTQFAPIENSNVRKWVPIKLGDDTAYIRKEDIVFYSFPSSSSDHIMYFISENYNTSIIHKYDLQSKTMIDTFKVKRFVLDDMEYFDASGWKNTSMLVSMKFTGSCCGCSSKQFYVIEANGKFEILFKTMQYQDDGEEESGYTTHVEFPSNPTATDIIYSEEEYSNISRKRQTKSYRWDGVKLVEQSKK